MAKLSKLFFFFLLLASVLLISMVSAFEFRVGGPRGWTKPTGNESESYNHWARRNRFHIGDSVYFKYNNDSVLMVDREDYSRCNTTHPLLKFADGNTRFRFDHYGFFYFISGEPDHCKSGQKLIIRVMVHPEFTNPAPGAAPFPQPSRGRGSESSPSGAPRSNAALKVAAAGSYNVLAGLGFAIVLLLFVWRN